MSTGEPQVGQRVRLRIAEWGANNRLGTIVSVGDNWVVDIHCEDDDVVAYAVKPWVSGQSAYWTWSHVHVKDEPMDDIPIC